MESDVIEFVDLLIENELQLGRYYQAMMDFIPKHEEAWSSLMCEEQAHAEALRRVRRAIVENPLLYAMGKCKPAAVRIMTEEVGAMIEKIGQNEVHPQYALTFIIDIEFSLIEASVEEALRTNVIEVLNILAWIKKQTELHHTRLRSIVID